MSYYPPPPPPQYPYQYPQQQQYPPPIRRYQIREKVFSFGDNFKIKDAVGQPIFTVRSKVFSIGDKLVLEDMAGNALMKIRQELLHLHPTFKIFSAQNEQALATIKKEFTFFRPKFTINSVYGEYILHGLDITAHYFTIMKNDQLVATVSKAYFSWSDTYGVEIIGNEDDAFIVTLVIVLDQIIYDQENNRNFHHR